MRSRYIKIIVISGKTFMPSTEEIIKQLSELKTTLKGFKTGAPDQITIYEHTYEIDKIINIINQELENLTIDYDKPTARETEKLILAKYKP